MTIFAEKASRSELLSLNDIGCALASRQRMEDALDYVTRKPLMGGKFLQYRKMSKRSNSKLAKSKK